MDTQFPLHCFETAAHNFTASGVRAPPSSQISCSCLSTMLLVSSLEPHRSSAPLPDLITFMDVMDFFMPVINWLWDCRKKLLVPFSVVFQLYGIMLWYVTFHHPFFKAHPSDRFALRWTGLLSRTHVASRTCDKYLMTSSKICERSHFCTIIGFVSTWPWEVICRDFTQCRWLLSEECQRSSPIISKLFIYFFCTKTMMNTNMR